MMADILTPAQRRKCMQAIRSKDTKPEVLLRKKLKKAKIKFKSNYKEAFGNPDMALVEEKVAVFCDSEYFHGKDWKKKKYEIKSNRKFWWSKIEKNIARDKKVNRQLKREGWKVVRVWNKEIKINPEKCVDKIIKTARVRGK